MAPKNFSSFIHSIWILLFVFGVASAQLTPDFYNKTCPGAFAAIDKVVRAAIANDPSMGASLLRLQFHDCFVNGCDGSVLLDDTPTTKGEKTAAPNNNSLRGFDVIDRIKAEVESLCPGVVSCADIVIITARDSVVAFGGTPWTVLLGRRDSPIANFSGANTDIPAPTLNLSNLITSFANKGLNAIDLVALSGAHTVGQARCINFRNRIYNDTNIDPEYAKALRGICPITGGDDNLYSFTESATHFDNDIYHDMIKKKVLLHSDQELYNGGPLDRQVEAYSKNPEAFAADFGNAMINMGNISPLTGTSGQIRLNCRKVN
ncbi:hypothetical protein SLEP1_g33942 [Rubroshorea leprosula]|uniref:Peroxidase n=1 Tax=Rubroshorea leprosula TaxID=152421 RepID=A0AAV5KI72_9ROSI|nr:hypothetical protein SLEP1_g33942 [Rubroshorea leprosula]